MKMRWVNTIYLSASEYRYDAYCWWQFDGVSSRSFCLDNGPKDGLWASYTRVRAYYSCSIQIILVYLQQIKIKTNMKFTVTKPTEVDVQYLKVFAGDNVYPEDIQIGDNEYEEWSDIFKDYPMLKGNCGYGAQLCLLINVETGHVDNWPENTRGYFENVKVVDEGVYLLLDDELNELQKYEGYVPQCLEITQTGYGDYWEFNIDSEGYIERWDFTQDDVNELFEIDED